MEFTVKTLREALAGFPDDTLIGVLAGTKVIRNFGDGDRLDLLFPITWIDTYPVGGTSKVILHTDRYLMYDPEGF